MVLLFVLIPGKALADEAVKDIPAGEDKIVGVKEGEKAPFTGQLFDPPTALRWANWLQQYKLRLAIEREMQQKVCSAEIELANRRVTIEQEKNKSVTEDLKKTVGVRDARIVDLEKAADNPPFFKTFWFGAVVGVVATGTLFGLGVYAAR